MKLDPRKAGVILNEMDSKAAADPDRHHGQRRPQGRPVMIRQVTLAVLALATLAGCGSTDLKEIGKEPALSPVGSGIDGRQPLASTPIPRRRRPGARNSRCGTTARAGCSPIRARCREGDILTVQDRDQRPRQVQEPESDRSRTAKRSLGLAAVSTGTASSTGGKGRRQPRLRAPTTNGDGATERSENIELSSPPSSPTCCPTAI